MKFVRGTIMHKALSTLATKYVKKKDYYVSTVNSHLVMHTFKKQDCMSIVDINSALCPKPKLGELSHDI